MRTLRLLCALACLMGWDPSQAAGVKLAPVSRQNLCVTEGAIEELSGQRLSVSVPKMRAYLERRTPQVIEARFEYLGGTSNEMPLGSGAVRRQFGLKLRAQDACNLVYAMWRFEPESQLVVSVKSNPLQHSSAECGNRGYRNIKAAQSMPVPPLRPGDAHTIHAGMSGSELTVLVDGRVVWEGSVGPEVANLDGPVGIRSDNAKLQFDLRAPLSAEPQPVGKPCRSGPEESE